MRVGEALKRGGTEKRERGNKDIKKEVGKARSRGGCLKKEGGVLEPPYIPCQK